MVGVKTAFTHDRVLGGISKYSYQSILSAVKGCIDWIGWRLARGIDGKAWPTRVPPEISNLSSK